MNLCTSHYLLWPNLTHLPLWAGCLARFRPIGLALAPCENHFSLRFRYCSVRSGCTWRLQCWRGLLSLSPSPPMTVRVQGAVAFGPHYIAWPWLVLGGVHAQGPLGGTCASALPVCTAAGSRCSDLHSPALALQPPCSCLLYCLLKGCGWVGRTLRKQTGPLQI